jgi:hypothetical protein
VIVDLDDAGAALGGVLELDVDEQAVATRPTPIMAVRILARRQEFTVLPSLEGRAFHVQPARSVRLLSVPGGQRCPPAVPT